MVRPPARGNASGNFNWRRGPTFDSLVRDVPKILGDYLGLVEVVDALNSDTGDALWRYSQCVTFRSGLIPRHYGRRSVYGIGRVTTSTAYPINTPQTLPVSFVGGLSVTFRLGTTNSLESDGHEYYIRHAVEKIQPATISTQIAILRKLLPEILA